MNLNSVKIPSSETFSTIVMNNEVSVVFVLSKTCKFEKRSQYRSQSSRPRAIFAGKYDDRGKVWWSPLTSKERINV